MLDSLTYFALGTALPVLVALLAMHRAERVDRQRRIRRRLGLPA